MRIDSHQAATRICKEQLAYRCRHCRQSWNFGNHTGRCNVGDVYKVWGKCRCAMYVHVRVTDDTKMSG